ncbi:unnamed protein product [Linum trigynum]|uniref:Uncharacterized protein n=1 Tax=Linum trigynum TaxID=586398 RepID=A0AAV2F379_9ROSI
MRGALSSLLALSIWLGERLLQIFYACFAASLENQVTSWSRSKYAATEIGRSKMGAVRPRNGDVAIGRSPAGTSTGDDAYDQSPTGTLIRSGRQLPKRKSYTLREDLESSPDKRVKRPRVRSSRGWIFWLPSPAEMEGDESLLTTEGVKNYALSCSEMAAVNQLEQIIKNGPWKRMESQTPAEAWSAKTEVRWYTRGTAGRFLFPDPRWVGYQSRGSRAARSLAVRKQKNPELLGWLGYNRIRRSRILTNLSEGGTPTSNQT